MEIDYHNKYDLRHHFSSKLGSPGHKLDLSRLSLESPRGSLVSVETIAKRFDACERGCTSRSSGLTSRSVQILHEVIQTMYPQSPAWRVIQASGLLPGHGL